MLGLLHRDVKPSNLVVCEGGEAKVIDFGIGRALSHDEITATGDVRGTLAYLAPERFAGHSGSAATDVWALGVVLFEATWDRPLFPGADLLGRFEHWDEALALRLPAGEPLAAVAARALRRAPSERFPSAAAFADALRATVTDADWTERRRAVAARVRHAQASPAPTLVEGGGSVTRVEVPEALTARLRGSRRLRTTLVAGAALALGLLVGRLAWRPPEPPRETLAPVDERLASSVARPRLEAPRLREAVADYYALRFAEANDALSALVARANPSPDAHYYRALVRAFGFGGRLELPMEPPPPELWPAEPPRRAVLELAVAFEQGRCREVLPEAEAVAARYPDDFELWFAIGECRFHNEQARAGYDAFVRAVELEPGFLPPVVHVQSFLVLQPSELLAQASQSWGEAGYDVSYLEIAADNWEGAPLREAPRGASAVWLTAWRHAVEGELPAARALLERPGG